MGALLKGLNCWGFSAPVTDHAPQIINELCCILTVLTLRALSSGTSQWKRRFTAGLLIWMACKVARASKPCAMGVMASRTLRAQLHPRWNDATSMNQLVGRDSSVDSRPSYGNNGSRFF
ncbi:hypothetical protein NDU88_005143 [Pleurodeles waltl]|uniref:Uncharacterized protein n=1 Tax=Pleurodeles waltl TaxID=8319 RepID=A0AAV7PHP8_PLEWA|nr:hypothetical protein NDU88_005143 [Pleurodeles waltl]